MPMWRKIARLYQFILFVALGCGPLILLAWKNARALPVGLLVFLSIAIYAFGLVVFVMGPASNRKILLVGGVILAALTVFSFMIAGDDALSRIGWSVLSLAVWMSAIRYGGQVIENAKRDARSARDHIKRAAEEAEIARKCAELASDPTKRGPVLARELSKYVETQKPFYNRGRYITFGDPVTNPGNVTVWAIITFNPYQLPHLDTFNHELRYFFTDLNRSLRKEGYVWTVGVGAVTALDVAAAGGDSKFFGADGSRVIPQWPATTAQAELSKALLPPLLPPARRSAG